MHVFFLDPIRHSSAREHELQAAAARSHAAKISHHRAKQRAKTKIRWPDSAEPRDVVDEYARVLDSDDPKKFGRRVAASIFPGFGSFRSELLDLIPNHAHPEDSRVLDFFVGVTLPGIDVANEMFDNSGVFPFILPNFVSFLLHSLVASHMDAMTMFELLSKFFSFI